MKTVHVPVSRPYDVLIGYGLLARLGEELAARHKQCRVALISDETVFDLYGEAAATSLVHAGFTVYSYRVAPGESCKSLATCAALLEWLAQHKLSRSDVVVALGGGTIGDLAGFAASIYLRGIEYVQVPTTLLAAVDSSVGGKTGINLTQGKNLVGSFWQPSLVLCDCDTFSTLPAEIFGDGVAESLKYGVICDRALFEQVARGVMDGDSMDAIARCVQIKAELVCEDERDTGRRQLLNLGHTIGHAIELLSGYTTSHGQAVAIGMVGAARISEALGLCAMGSAGIVMAMLERLDLPVETIYDAGSLARAAMSDKKRSGDMITLILMEGIGKCVLHPVPAQELPRFFRMAKGERV